MEKIKYSVENITIEEIEIEVDLTNCFFFSMKNKYGNQPYLYRGHFKTDCAGRNWVQVIEFTNFHSKHTWSSEKYDPKSNVFKHNSEEFFNYNPNYEVITKEFFIEKFNSLKEGLWIDELVEPDTKPKAPVYKEGDL